MKQYELKRRAVPDNVRQKEEAELSIPLAIHANNESGCITISYPGAMGDIDGYNAKYRTLADFIQEKVGAVIRLGNHYHRGFDYGKSIQDDLRAVISYAIKNSKEICGAKVPVIYLMGFSAGASAIAAVAYEFPQVRKILLISPSGDAGEEDVTKGLAEFTGEVYIVAGENDDVVGPEAAPMISNMVKKASIHKLVIVPKCDHQFRGLENGMIMSKAPIWAFLGDQDYPSPNGGIELYR
jgi:alpha/beta superfamily hydrolase